MFIFNQVFTAKSKKTNEPFYSVRLFERRERQDNKEVYFREVQCFVGKDVYEKIVKAGYKFGDIVAVTTGEPPYFGATAQLVGLELLQESPFIEL